MGFAWIGYEFGLGADRLAERDQLPSLRNRYVPVRLAMQCDQGRQVLDFGGHSIGHAAIEHRECGDTRVPRGGVGGDVAAQREAEQADAPGTVGPAHDGRHGGGDRVGPIVEPRRVKGIAALTRAGLRRQRGRIGRCHIAEKIDVDALGGQRIRISLVGAEPKLDAAGPVQHNHGRALPGHRRRVT